MILNAYKLDVWDRCERRLAFEKEWEPKTISPLGLLYLALEHALISDDPEQAAKDETIRVAQTRELDSGDHNAFMTIRHLGYLAGIIAVALRQRLGPLTKVEVDFSWESALFETASGIRHRIELVSHWDDDRLRAAAHSWRVVGELAALQAPLTLTAVVIGPQRAGRRHSYWSKGVLHPTNSTLRFERRRGRGGNDFTRGWEDVWREQRAEISTERWLNVMRSDNVLDEMILSREIAFNRDDPRMGRARKDLIEIACRMKNASTKAPMRRSSCDETGRGACPFQHVCYAPKEITPADLVHIYRQIEDDS